jgi:hypothetical protein
MTDLAILIGVFVILIIAVVLVIVAEFVLGDPK